MARRKIDYVEKEIDSNGIERIYGYNVSTGTKYFLNLQEVIKEYEKRGLEGFKRVV